MKNGKRKYQRRTVLSNPVFQIKLLIFFSLLAILYGAMNFYVSTHTLNAISDDVLGLTTISEHAKNDITILVQQRRTALMFQLALITALSFITLGLGGLYLSHKIGGPVGRLYRYMQSLLDGWGSPQPVYFRKYDFFDELAAIFNQFQQHVGLLPKSGEPDEETSDVPEVNPSEKG